MLLGAVSALPAFLLDWFAVSRDWSRAKYLTKPLALVVLMGWFAAANFTLPHEPAIWGILLWFFAGQVLSLAGDIFLLLPDRYFSPGLLAFLLAHVCYIISLRGWEARPEAGLFVCIAAALVVSSFYYRILYKRLILSRQGGKLCRPVAVYIIAINLMLISTVSTFFNPGWFLVPAILVVAGGLLFFASDGLLACNKFLWPVSNGCLKIRILYHLGQLSLAAGLTLQLAMSGQ